MDEGVISPVDLREFIRLKMIDGVAMKHSRCGGLLSAKRQIELILSEGLMWVGSGLTDPDISLGVEVDEAKVRTLSGDTCYPSNSVSGANTRFLS